MEIGAITMASCILSLMCVGLILIGLLFLFRMATGSVRGVFNRFDNQSSGDVVYDSPRAQPAAASSLKQKRGLRDRADNLDFDSAVQRYRQEQSGGDLPERSIPPRATVPDDWDVESPLRRKRGRDRRGQDDYDLLIDEDGDGI